MIRFLLLFFVMGQATLVIASSAAPTREELRQTVAHIAQLARSATAENNALKADLQTTRDALTEQQQHADTLRTWGIDQQTRADAAEMQVARDRKMIAEKDAAIAAREAHIRRDKWWICAALALAVLLLVAKLEIPPPLGLYALAAAPAAAFGAAWLYF